MLGKFNNLVIARSFSASTVKASAIILGDDNKFWVVYLATFEKLIRSGYNDIK